MRKKRKKNRGDEDMIVKIIFLTAAILDLINKIIELFEKALD